MSFTDTANIRDIVVQELEKGLIIFEIIPNQDYIMIENPEDANETRNVNTLGKQMRHVYDFPRLFLEGYTNGHIDYTNRPQNPDVENDRNAALAHATDIITRLKKMTPLEKRLYVTTDTGTLVSTTPIELDRLYNHTLHHYPVIKDMIIDFYGSTRSDIVAVITETFSLSPSTINK